MFQLCETLLSGCPPLPSCRFCPKLQKRNGTGRCGFVAKAPQELHFGLRGAHFVVFIFCRDRACPISTKKSFPQPKARGVLLALEKFYHWALVSPCGALPSSTLLLLQSFKNKFKFPLLLIMNLDKSFVLLLSNKTINLRRIQNLKL